MRHPAAAAFVSALLLAAVDGIAGVDAGVRRVAAIPDAAWADSAWICVPDAPTAVFDGNTYHMQPSAPGTSWFVGRLENSAKVKKATWMTAGLGVYEVYVNGARVGDDFLKPGFTHNEKTKYSFTYDVTDLVKTGTGDENFFAAEVSSGWWRDKIVDFYGRRSAFRGVVEVEYSDGGVRRFGTGTNGWTCATAGAVGLASIYEGERFDARVPQPYFGAADFKAPAVSDEFKGTISPTCGGEVTLRRDLALKPVKAYCWKGVEDAGEGRFGRVAVTRSFAPEGPFEIAPGETLVVDFGQNCAAVPAFVMESERGCTLTCLPGEMLNDMNGEKSRGNDGPGGSVYRANLVGPMAFFRFSPDFRGFRTEYVFAGAGEETYMPRFTFFGYRYVSITATAPVKILSLQSIPVSSIARGMERGRLETGVPELNRLLSNAWWGQLSNYLSVGTDCPQRWERLGYLGDTMLFCESGAFNADTRTFLRKFMRDVRESQDARGGFTVTAPPSEFKSGISMRLGSSDGGVIIPYEAFKMFGDRKIVEENWDAMERYMRRLDETECEHDKIADENDNYQWADWLAFDDLESSSSRVRNPDGSLKRDAILYWNFHYTCFWILECDMMERMARGTGNVDGAAKYAKMAARARSLFRAKFVDEATGMISPVLRGIQTANVMALSVGVLEGEARRKTADNLRSLIEAEGEVDVRGRSVKVSGALRTGFQGTHYVMDALADNGMADLAYTLLLSHKFPGWLYSVDQGATTMWERWNSYTKEDGFGPAEMNSFNHYAFGQVVEWIWRRAAGIAANPSDPGFRTVVMSPLPDRRLGYVKAELDTDFGTVKSHWRYEGGEWVWDFTVPSGVVARVTIPGESAPVVYQSGTHAVRRRID